MQNEILVLFLTAHIVGDFYFQTENLANNKKEKFTKLLLHCLIYLIATVVLIAPVFNINLLWSALIISALHFLIDVLKVIFTKKYSDKQSLLYASDQLLHIISIIAVSFIFGGSNIQLMHLDFLNQVFHRFSYAQILKVLLLFLSLLKPTNITFKNLFSFVKPSQDSAANNPNIGALIGTLERILIIIFLLFEEYASIGLIFTAKSIARYNKISEDKSFAEYYLLGTLYSVLSAVILYLFIWKGFML